MHRRILLAALATTAACTGDDFVDPFATASAGGSSTGSTDTGPGLTNGEGPGTTSMDDTTGGAKGTDSDGGTTMGVLDGTDTTSDGGSTHGGTTDGGGSSTDGGSTNGTTDGGGSSGSTSQGSTGDGGMMGIPCPAGVIDSIPSTVTGSTVGQGSEFGGTCGGIGAPDLAYVLTADIDGYYVFDTFGSSLDTVLYVLAGECGGAELACNDDGDQPPQSSVGVALAAGQTVTAVVDGFGLASGDVTLNVVYAGACPNDDLGSTAPQTVTGSTVADGNTLSDTCGGDLAPDRAYTFTAPSSGVYTIDTAGSAFDTVLYVRDGACDGPTLACSDNAGGALGTASRVDVTLSQGQEIVIVVDGGGSSSGDFTLNIEPDICPDEALPSIVPQTVTGSTTSDVDSSGECVGGTAPDYAYTYVAPMDGLYVFDTVGSAFDTGLYLYEGATCDGTVIACNDNAVGLGSQSRVLTELVAGQQVTIVVDGFGTSSGNYSLDISTVECPNEDLGSAVPTTAMGSTVGQPAVFWGSCGGGSASEVKYRWEAPADGTYTFSTEGSTYDTVLYVRDGACDGPELACDDDIGGGNYQSEVTVDLTAGQQVTVVVDGFADFSSGAFILSIN